MTSTDKAPAGGAVTDKKGKGSDKDGKKKKVDEEEELSEEDQQLKSELEMLVQRVSEPDQSLHNAAIANLARLIKESTTSMTSVPKPLKFLTPHYAPLKAVYDTWVEGADKTALADVLSCLAITLSADEEAMECLNYRLKAAPGQVASWGHEYVRHVSNEVAMMFDMDRSARDQLMVLVKEILPYCLSHNAESEASDLALELEALDVLEELIDETNFERVCRYLVGCVPHVAAPENVNILNTCINIYLKQNRHPDALRLALQLHDMKVVKRVFSDCKEPIVQKQLALILANVLAYIDLEEEMEGEDEDVIDNLMEMMSNRKLHEFYLELGRDLDVMEPKLPEDVYKSHLEATPRSGYGSNMESSQQNLASTFVNAFVNAGFSQDKLLSGNSEGSGSSSSSSSKSNSSSWVYKNKDTGSLSAVASLGMIYLWDVSPGLSEIDKFLYSEDDNVKAGALLACGLVGTGVRFDEDPAKGLLSDYVTHKSNIIRTGAVIGLGLAYAGTQREDIADLLTQAMNDERSTPSVVGVCAVSLGLVYVASADPSVGDTLLQTMMEQQQQLTTSAGDGRFVALALGLVFLGKQDAAQAILKTLEVALEDPFSKVARTTLEVCSYAGTGNVLKVQEMLHLCTELFDEEKDDENDFAFQSIAVLGIALVSMGEEIGAEMVLRTFTHLIQFGSLPIKRAVPLALALLSTSSPKLSVLDTLNKLSHDQDPIIAQNAILGLGFIGAGTNNARVAEVLRQLMAYWRKESNHRLMVRLAQGILHMGKGTMTISPFVGDRQIHEVALGGLLVVMMSCLDLHNTLLGKQHYLLYYLSAAMRPRFLMTVNEDLESVPCTVRVGQAVDVVGQAGRPKTITGFQTHTTPVLLAQGERAEMANDEWEPVSHVLEGIVIVKKKENRED